MNDESAKPRDPQLEILSSFLTYRVSRLHGKLNAQASKILNESVGLTLNQWRMMAFIGAAETLTASALISYTAMDKGLVSRNVRALIELGHVSSTPDTRDSRVSLLRLTEKGRAVFDIALPRMRRRQDKLKQNLSADDIATFHKVVAALEIASEDTDP